MKYINLSRRILILLLFLLSISFFYGISPVMAQEAQDDRYESRSGGEFAENDSYAGAIEIPEGYHTQLAALDDDFYWLNVQQGDYITVLLTFTYEPANLDLYLYFLGGIVEQSTLTGLYEIVRFQATTDHDVVIRVQPMNDKNAMYALDIEVEPGVYNAPEAPLVLEADVVYEADLILWAEVEDPVVYAEVTVDATVVVEADIVLDAYVVEEVPASTTPLVQVSIFSKIFSSVLGSSLHSSDLVDENYTLQFETTLTIDDETDTISYTPEETESVIIVFESLVDIPIHLAVSIGGPENIEGIPGYNPYIISGLGLISIVAIIAIIHKKAQKANSI